MVAQWHGGGGMVAWQWRGGMVVAHLDGVHGGRLGRAAGAKRERHRVARGAYGGPCIPVRDDPCDPSRVEVGRSTRRCVTRQCSSPDRGATHHSDRQRPANQRQQADVAASGAGERPCLYPASLPAWCRHRRGRWTHILQAQGARAAFGQAASVQRCPPPHALLCRGFHHHRAG